MDEENRQISSELLNDQVATNIRWLHKLVDYYKSKGHHDKAEEIMNALRDQNQVELKEFRES